MDNIRIQTTQNVDIEYEIASVGDRILAALLDYAFLLGYGLIALFLISLLRLHGVIAYLYLLFLIPIVFYNLCFETFFEGKSPGKMIMKIKVVKIDGSRASFGAYLLRWFFRMIDIDLMWGSLALITVVLNGRGQRLGDLAAGTAVIKIKQRVKLHDTILNRVKPEYTVVFPEVSRLSDTDVDIIKDAMRISIISNNMEALNTLFTKTRDVMGVTTQLLPAQFLHTVLLDYSYYTFDK